MQGANLVSYATSKKLWFRLFAARFDVMLMSFLCVENLIKPHGERLLLVNLYFFYIAINLHVKRYALMED